MLKQAIKNAQTNEDLKNAILSIPKQDNGHRSQLYRMLGNAFWYPELDTVAKKKTFMLDRLPAQPPKVVKNIDLAHNSDAEIITAKTTDRWGFVVGTKEFTVLKKISILVESGTYGDAYNTYYLGVSPRLLCTGAVLVSVSMFHVYTREGSKNSTVDGFGIDSFDRTVAPRELPKKSDCVSPDDKAYKKMKFFNKKINAKCYKNCTVQDVIDWAKSNF